MFKIVFLSLKKNCVSSIVLKIILSFIKRINCAYLEKKIYFMRLLAIWLSSQYCVWRLNMNQTKLFLVTEQKKSYEHNHNSEWTSASKNLTSWIRFWLMAEFFFARTDQIFSFLSSTKRIVETCHSTPSKLTHFYLPEWVMSEWTNNSDQKQLSERLYIYI